MLASCSVGVSVINPYQLGLTGDYFERYAITNEKMFGIMRIYSANVYTFF